MGETASIRNYLEVHLENKRKLQRKYTEQLKTQDLDENAIINMAEKCSFELQKITIPANHEPIENAFRTCLSDYIKIETISPEGNEEKTVKFLETIFKNLGIAYKTFDVPDLNHPSNPEKRRINLLATLPHDHKTKGSEKYNYRERKKVKSIILTHHMDVVAVNPNQWLTPDLVFSGKIALDPKDNQEYIYGRGALDMKGIGISQLITMILIKNSGTNMNYDLHYLALSDEESQGSGAIGTLEIMNNTIDLNALKDAKILLNEGGGALSDVPKNNQILNVISAEQKGGAWLEVSDNNIENLIYEIHKGGLLSYNFRKALRNKNKYKSKLNCEIADIRSPVKKVNVVSSEITVNFDCSKDSLTLENIKLAMMSTIKDYMKSIQIFEFDDPTESKSNFKLRFETSSASHGSISLGGNVITGFVKMLYELDMVDFKSRFPRPKFKKRRTTFATLDLLKNLREKLLILKTIYLTSWIPGIKNFVLALLESSFDIQDLFRTTCQLTNLYKEGNQFKALVDCRLLHTAFKYGEAESHAKIFLEEVKRRIKNPKSSFHIISGWNFSYSKVDTQEIRTIKEILKSYGKENVVTTFLFPAGTDSVWFRTPKAQGFMNLEPIPSYGFYPIVYSAELAGSIHGSNERYPTKEILPTNLKYYQVVKQLLDQ